MGKAAAAQVLSHGGRVLLVSRSMDKLKNAKNELLQGDALPENNNGDDDRVLLTSVDITSEQQVQDLASSPLFLDRPWNGLVITAAGRAAHGSVESLATQDARDMMESKLWGAYYAAKHLGTQLDTTSSDSGAAIVFCAGILNRRPGLNCSPLAMANGALEGLTRTLALELGTKTQGRIRVNCLSPGFCDTERFDQMDDARRKQMMDNTAASLPLQKVGKPRDMGEAIFYLLTAPFCTGVVLDVDGGHGIRQYANPQKDPMRRND